MVSDKMEYKIHPSVFYRKINDKVVLYCTSQNMIYTFSNSSIDIFDFFSTANSFDKFLIYLKDKYKIDESDIEFNRNIGDFFEELIQNGIIIQNSKDNNYSGILENEISDEFANSNMLYSATIELTYRCNEKCRHCYVYDEGGEEMSANQIMKILDDLSNMGVATLLFTGGEVFARKDIFEILEYAYKKHFAMDIFTNGTLLNESKIIKLKNLWPKSIQFSVYSHIPQKHDAVTQINGSYEKTITAIKTCIAVGIPVKIKMPVFTETADDISGVIELAKSLGASVSVSNDITPKKNGDTSPLEMRILNNKKLGDVSKNIEDKLGDLYKNPDSKTLDSRICSAGARMISINPYGKVYPCANFPMCIGDALTQNIKDIWENSKELNKWRKLNKTANRKECINCEHLKYCRYCPGEAIMYNGSPVLKYQDACYVCECKFKADK